jgi:hypothetical protein
MSILTFAPNPEKSVQCHVSGYDLLAETVQPGGQWFVAVVSFHRSVNGAQQNPDSLSDRLHFDSLHGGDLRETYHVVDATD